jgi:hypothetical protein
VPVERWLRDRETACRMRSLLVERREGIEFLTGVEPLQRLEQFLADDRRATHLASAGQVLWLAAVGCWADRFGISGAARPSLEEAAFA